MSASRLLTYPLRAICLILALSVPSLQAQYDLDFTGVDPQDAVPKVTASLLSEVASAAPGETFTVAIRLDHLEHWHSYWKNSGGVSMPTEVRWSLPDGFAAGEIQWPTPKVIPTGTINGYSYEETVYLLANISVPASAAIGSTVEIAATVDWQACEVECVPGTSEPKIRVRIGEKTNMAGEASAIFAEARSKIAQASGLWNVEVTKTPAGVDIALTPNDGANPEITSAHFFPDENYVNLQKDQKLEKTATGYVLHVPFFDAAEKEDSLNAAVDFGGTLGGDLAIHPGVDKNNTVGAIRIDIKPGEGAPADAPRLSFALLGLAFLGGLILNLMPCVFPVIGLKIMGFVNQAGEDRKKIIIHGLIFTLGVLVSFWVLVGALQILREVFGQVPTWGRQLQEPWFVLGLIILLFIFSLSLVGLMEIGIGATAVGGKLSRRGGLAGTFFSGVFATVVATPCAAPFLAPALGAAMALPVIPSFVAFTAIALGLSLPYLVLSAFPQLVDLLPKPGPWMETFKQLMSFLLFATVAYLVWVFATLFPDDSTYLRGLLFGLVVIALGCYVYGRWSSPWRAKGVRRFGTSAALLLILGGSFLAWPTKHDYKVDWQAWSPQAVDEAIAAGKPVFIDFTASWCVTCLANKSRYEHNKKVVTLMEEKGVVAFKADNTTRRDDIARAIAVHGRIAVPVNLLYTPGKEKPELLDETFGASYLLEKFGALPDKK